MTVGKIESIKQYNAMNLKLETWNKLILKWKNNIYNSTPHATIVPFNSSNA
jgi:hypothetical protein